MKKETYENYNKIANDILYYIYTHIDLDISLDELSSNLKVSKYHMHRIFKSIFSTNIYKTIKSIRLQKAANLLIINANTTISQIAKSCGYSSLSSFINAFKKEFSMTPSKWRDNGYKEYSKRLLKNEFKYSNITQFSNLSYEIVNLDKIKAYYIRHKGYDSLTKEVWQKLKLFTISNNIKEFKSIALYHDNPAIKPLKECAYVAAIATKKDIKESKLPFFYISSGVYAKFDIKGEKGDDIRLIHYIYHHFLPKHGFETTPKPSFAIYHKNHFLEEKVDLSYYVSITF